MSFINVKLILALLIAFSFSTTAMPVSHIRFKAKVISIDSKWIWIEGKKARLRIARNSVNSQRLRSGELHEFALSPEQYNKMKVDNILISQRRPNSQKGKGAVE